MHPCYTRRPHVTWWDTPEESSNTVEVKPQQSQISFTSWLRSKWTIFLLTGVAIVIGFVLLYSFWKSRTSTDSAVFPIERAPVSAGLYEGVKDPQIGKGTGSLEVTSATLDDQIATSYKLYYSIPKDGDAYAGISLWFSEPQDLTEYKYIELTISFGDNQARCRLFIKDSFTGYGFVMLGDGNIVSAKQDEQTIKIPLKSFSSISRKLVKDLDFDVNGDFVRGDNSFTVSNIRFLK